MDPPATLGVGPPAIKIKKEVKEEPEYIYVDETVCRVKLEEGDEEVILPKDDMVLGSESDFQPMPSPVQSQPARRGRKPKMLRASRGNTHTCTTTARKILPRPSPMPVPLTLSHLQPPPPPLSLPPSARSKPPQTPVMVRPALQPPAPNNSGRKILPWPHQLTPASLAPASQQQKLQPLNPSLTTCPPSSAQTLPLTHLQPMSAGANSGLMPLQPLSLTQLRSPPPSSCISQLGVPLSPQKISVPPKGSRKTVATLPKLAAGPPTSCTKVPLLPLSDVTVKKSSPSLSMQATTINHVRKLLPRPLKAAVRPATSALFQQQQQGALTALQQLHPVPPVSTQQTVSLQQLQTLNSSNTQTTKLALQTLNVSGQPPPLSGSSQVVSLQHVPALAATPPQASQKVNPPEPPLLPPHHPHTGASSTSPQRLTCPQAQQAPSISVPQAVAIHSLSLPALAPSSQQQQTTSSCQGHTLQSSASYTHSCQEASLQTIPSLVADSQKAVPAHSNSSHVHGDVQAMPLVGSKSPLPQGCSASCCTLQSTAPSQAVTSEQQTLTFHELSSACHTGRDASTLCPDTGHPAQGQDVVNLSAAPRQSITAVGSGMPVGSTSNGKLLKVPIQPLRSSASFPKVKRRYLRRTSRQLKASKKKDVPILKLGSVSTYSWPLNVQEKDLYVPSPAGSAVQGRKILPRPCLASVVGSQLEHVQPVTSQCPSGWAVPQVREHEGCGTVVASLGSLTHTTTSLSESQLPTLGLPQRVGPLDHMGINSLAATHQGKASVGESFLQPVSPAKAVAACSFVPHDKKSTITQEGSSDASQEGVSPGGSQVTDDDSSDQPSLEGTESCSISKPDVDCMSGRFPGQEDSMVTVKGDMHSSGDSAPHNSTSQITLGHNTHSQHKSENTSGPQDQPTLQDTTGDNTPISQDDQGNSIRDQSTSQEILRDSFQDYTLPNTSGNSTQSQCTSKVVPGHVIQGQPISQDSQGHSVHSLPTLHDDLEENISYQPTMHSDPVGNILGHASSQDVQGDNTVGHSASQPSSTPPLGAATLVVTASQREQHNLRQEDRDHVTQNSSFEDNRLPTNDFFSQPSSPMQDQDVCSPSSSCPLQSRLSDAGSPIPPLEATAVDGDSYRTQEQNNVCPFNENPSASLLSQNQSWEPSPSLLHTSPPGKNKGSLGTNNLSLSTSPCAVPTATSTVCLNLITTSKSSFKTTVSHKSPEDKLDVLHAKDCVSSPSDSVAPPHLSCPSPSEIMMTRKTETILPMTMLPQYSTYCSFLKKEDVSAADSSTLHPDFRVITATTTAVAATTTTVTITATTTAVSTTSTFSQDITTHMCVEPKVKESSTLLSQEKKNPSPNAVPTSCHLTGPDCPQADTLLEQDTHHKECQAPPEVRRKTRKICRQQQNGLRLRALVRAQNKTIEVLRHKLNREQRRSRALWEALKRSMVFKASSRGEVCPRGNGAAKLEEGEEITRPCPSPPVTRNRKKLKQVAAATLSTSKLKRKHEDRPTEVPQKIMSLDHLNDHGLEENAPHMHAIRVPTPSAGKTELQTLVREFMMRDDVSRPTLHGTRHCLHYLPLLHKRFMADCCQPCSLETFQQLLPPQMAQRVGEELETCVCLTCQNPELKVESLVRRRLLPLNTHLEDLAFSPESTFKEFQASVQALKTRPLSQLSYSEWVVGVGGGSSAPLPQKRTLTQPLREVATQLEGELDLLRLHLTRAARQYEATFRAKCEAEQSPRHAVLQAEWSPLIILHALGADGTPKLQRVVSLQCGYLWSHTDSLGFIAVSGCRDQRAAAVCASLEALLARLIQQGVRCFTLLVDPKTDLSAVLEYSRRRDLEVHWVYSEPGHGAGVAEAVGNSVTQLICDTVNSWGPESVLSAKDVFSLISPNSSNLVYYYSEEDVWRSGQLLHGPAGPTKTTNKLIKPKTLLSL